MKFDFVIGNPPYQKENADNNRQPPVYDKFMNASYKIADYAELIHPARFLFNAGQTSKEWNEQMLNDKHFKVLHYENNSAKIFPGTDIKGGVAITVHNNNKDYGAIKVFTVYQELNQIAKKVRATTTSYLSSCTYAKSSYKLS